MSLEKIKKLSGHRALILAHDNPDPDVIAAAWGMSFLLDKIRGIPSTIAYGGLIGRAENRAMVSRLNIPLFPFAPDLLDGHPLLLLLDAQPNTGNTSLPPDVVPDVIIDHHPLRETTAYRLWAHIDEKTGATSSLITGYIIRSGLDVSEDLATALFYAISSETRNLGLEGNQTDRDSYFFLFPQINFKKLYQIEHPPLSPSFYRKVKDAIGKSRVFDFLAVCPLGRVPYPELPAEIADFLLQREGVDISLAMGHYKGDVFLSIRSRLRKNSSADMMRNLLSGLGTGGGHEMMAGGKIPCVRVSERAAIEAELTKRMLRIFSLESFPGIRLYERGS